MGFYVDGNVAFKKKKKCMDSICNDSKLVRWVRTLKVQTIKFVESGLKGYALVTEWWLAMIFMVSCIRVNLTYLTRLFSNTT